MSLRAVVDPRFVEIGVAHSNEALLTLPTCCWRKQACTSRIHVRITLGKDHIHHFTTNPERPRGNIKHGFLALNVQVFLRGNQCWVLPNARPGETLKIRSDEIGEKWVDSRYPFDSGIQQKNEAAGYRVAWCLDTKLARKIELEGWEVVIESDARGVPSKFRMKDRPADQTLIKKRNP